MAPCPDENTLLALVEGKLSRLIATPIQRHIEKCRSCQIVSAEAARTVLSDVVVAPAAERASLGPGAVVAERFELVSCIGQGGVGTVWSARRLADHAPIAIKILRTVEPELVRRVLREARLSQQVVHSVFVPIQEVLSLEAGRPALVMELLQGEDLAVYLDRSRALSQDETVKLLVPLAEGLAALHGQQIAHRDLKPENVFLERRSSGETAPRILDLGMARSLDLEQASLNASRLTTEGTVLGTPRYMAPEQLEGSREVDTRADIWALGALAYRMLSGLPHIAAWRYGDVVRALYTEPIVELSTRVPELQASLARLVRESLSVKPELRPSADGWLMALRELLVQGAAGDA